MELKRLTYILMGIALILSLLLVVNSLGLLKFDSEDMHLAKSYAHSLVEYNLELGDSLGVPNNATRVNFYRNRLEESIDKARSVEELSTIIMTDMAEFEQIIQDEAKINITNHLGAILARDTNILELEEPVDFTFSFLVDQPPTIEGGELLTRSTVLEISELNMPAALSLELVTITVDASADPPTTEVNVPLYEETALQHLQSNYQYLSQELDKLRKTAGYAELSGPGLQILLMDAEKDYTDTEYRDEYIIHDEDVQQVVHSLFAGGAQGVSVGGKRIVANSSIRCVGGPILINYEPVSGSPLVVEAVGNGPEMLRNLQPILDYYSDERSLQVEVNAQEEIRLPASTLR